jgi:pyridoxine/pyridoxamine 5'-phosphate oxidase
MLVRSAAPPSQEMLFECWREKHFTVLSTINKDGSSQLTTVLYALNDDETMVMNTEVHSQKALIMDSKACKFTFPYVHLR